MSFGESVWERSGASAMSRNQFMLLMGFFTMLGLALSAVCAFYAASWIEVIPPTAEGAKSTFNWVGPVNPILLFVGVLVSGILGVIIALKSDNPIVSLLGYALVAAPFGLMLGPVVEMYTAASVVKVVLVTGCVVGVLTIVGAVIPDSLDSWGGWLFGGLCILLAGTFGIPFLGYLFPGFPVQGALTLWDWVGVVLFSAYVIFDVNRATRVPATVDNAIDCALALYLDILNLFIRLLSLMGKKK